MSFSYRVLRAVVGSLCRLCARFEVAGLENVPPSGPLIVAMNHIHFLDSPVAMAAMPRQVTALAARKWERDLFLGLLLRMAGVIFVTRGEVDRRALRRGLAVLENGGILGVAPEGTRSPNHQLQAARGGVAYIAHLSGAPILPVAVTGVEHVVPALRRLRQARVRVVIGKPFALPLLDHKPKTDELLDLADGVMRHIAALLPNEYRGVYAKGSGPVERTPAPQD